MVGPLHGAAEGKIEGVRSQRSKIKNDTPVLLKYSSKDGSKREGGKRRK